MPSLLFFRHHSRTPRRAVLPAAAGLLVLAGRPPAPARPPRPSRPPRPAQFTARLAEAAVHGRDAVAIANAESARLLCALNDAAAYGPRLARGRKQCL